MIRLVLVSLALVLACTPAGDDSADAGTESNGDGDGECYDITNDITGVEVIDCSFNQPCDTAVFASSGICEVMAVYDSAVAACIVEQLAAGTEALHEVRDCPGGQFSEIWRLQVFGDGTVLYVNNSAQDIGGTGRGTWRAMPDAAYFQACETDTPQGLIECLEGIPQQECQTGEPTCP